MEWTQDVLGEGYEASTISLSPDDEGDVVATLVRRRAGTGPAPRAVLHVHGFADYFFQTVAADYWTARGYDFYALDLRKYGRSLRPGQSPGLVTDLRAYYEELDLAWAEISGAHQQVVLSAHSTGGLTVPLWVHDRRPAVRGVLLNAPWLDMHGDVFTRLAALPTIQRLGAIQPKRVVPRKVTGLYAKSLHRDYLGEWDFDLSWKPLESFPVYAGWLRAVRIAQTRIAAGLDVEAPVLMVSSARSGQPRDEDDPDLVSTDIVLDVRRMRLRAVTLSRQVTVAQVPGALHDVTLSPEPARTEVFDQLSRWLSAYVEAPAFRRGS